EDEQRFFDLGREELFERQYLRHSLVIGEMHAGDDPLELEPSVVRADAGPQSANDGPGVRIVGVGREEKRSPHLCIVREGEAGQHHADHGVRHAVEDDTPSNDRRVAGERAVPELIAEYGDVIPSRRVLAGDEASAKCRTHAEDAHEVRGDAGSVETYRVAGTGKGELRGTERRDALEGASLAMKCEIRSLIETGRHLVGSRRRSVRDEKESLRVGEGKGPQQDAVDDG